VPLGDHEQFICAPGQRRSVLVRATDQVTHILNSISHGTGRKMSRSDCKPLADHFDFAAM
jgi:RNA-splicing ligase RtcB